MKKTEGEILREYSQIIYEADGNPDNWRDFEPEGASEPMSNGTDGTSGDWGPGEPDEDDSGWTAQDDADREPNPDDFEPATDDAEGEGEEDTPEGGWEQGDFNDEEGNGSEPEANDPVTELGDYLSSKDTNNMDFVTEIQKYLKEKNLEIVPIGGLTNHDGNI
jgi:hypothetical protein